MENVNMVSSYYRGHKIIEINGEWFYEDNNELVSNDKDRICGCCKKEVTKEGYDGCLGILPGVMNACCGHGETKEAYIQFNNENCIRGKKAIDYILFGGLI